MNNRQKKKKDSQEEISLFSFSHIKILLAKPYRLGLEAT
jgi:hypothetical protein